MVPSLAIGTVLAFGQQGGVHERFYPVGSAVDAIS